MKLPSLSVVVPNYNHAAFLPACLNALLRQSVPPQEVIIVDDASTDNSRDVIECFARTHANIRVLWNERNKGVVLSLNRGLELARGDYVFFPGADDEVTPGLFEKSLSLLAEHPQAALSCTISEWQEGPMRWHMGAGMSDHPSYFSPKEMIQLGKRGKLLIVTHSAIFRKETFCQAGCFIPELRWHSDWYVTYVSGFRHGICYVPEILSKVEIHPQSYYKTGSRKEQHRQVLLNLLNRLNSPACADVTPRIRDSGALFLFAMPMLRLLLSHAEYRRFVTPALVRMTLRRSVELQAKRFFPEWLSRWCLNTFYRHQGEMQNAE